MDNIEHVLDTLSNVERHLKLLSTSTCVEDVVGATSSYLASWSKDRIEVLRKIDGGWGPFEFQGRPEPIREVADIARISDALNRQCVALKEAGIDPTSEILELDLFFVFAKQAAETLRPIRTRTYTQGSHGRHVRPTSDRIGAAA